MKKIQVLFPEPALERLRAIAKADDRPLSEVVRRSVEFLLERVSPPAKGTGKKKFPFFNGGEVLVDSKCMREAVYEDTP